MPKPQKPKLSDTEIRTTFRLLIATLLLGTAFYFSNNAQAADITAPITTVEQTPSSPDGKSNWYVTPVQFKLTATDLESGIKSINYRIDEGTWKTVNFADTLNLAPNPSFETPGATSSGLDSWEATTIDTSSNYMQDTLIYAPGYSTSSARITSTAAGWHGINNAQNFAVTGPYDNMSASIMLKTSNVTQNAYFKVFAVTDSAGTPVYTLLGQSAAITGTTNWTSISFDFVVNLPDVDGVYIDIGLDGPGTLWTDAVTISSAVTAPSTTFVVGSDSANHKVEYYSVDWADNAEIYNCSSSTNCITFKLDSTPPGNWHNSGAFRGFFGSDHELYVYTEVDDATSGISTFTDKYQYKVDTHSEYGRFNNILSCSSTWKPNDWVILISPPFFPGVKSAYLLTPKTDFCNSNWKVCKVVRFYSEDLAGNSATKDFCINGPWIRFNGEGIVRSNYNIDMLAEADNKNTDGLIETEGNTVNFFTTSKGWMAKNTSSPTVYSYDDFYNRAGSKTNITGGNLVASNGVYVVNGNYEITNPRVPNSYDNNNFDQVVFINGNLRISSEIEVNNNSTALFIVKGNVEIAKNVRTVGIAIFADGYFDTAYDISEGDSTQTLELYGIYSADHFIFKRNLQGTNNDDSPSDDFYYEPKYLLQQREMFGNEKVIWRTLE